MNYGKSVEDFVEYLCGCSFFADFTFRSPEYQKLGGQQKEAADVLVVFGKTLLAIQVKSKQIDAANGELSFVEGNRLWAKVEEATQQFRAIAEAMNNPNFKSFRNGRGVTARFDKQKITEFVFIVVFAPIWKTASERLLSLKFSETCLPDGDIALHLFTLDQFSVILTLLDTTPDFLLYLNTRWMLYRHKLLPKDTDPIDEWAFVTFERAKVAQLLKDRVQVNIRGINQMHRESIRLLEQEEKPSYLIDRLIELSNFSIGSNAPIHKKLVKNATMLALPNSQEAFQLVVPFLARLNRNERRRLGEHYLTCVARCREKPISFRGLQFERYQEAYIVMASTWKGPQRQVALFNIGRALGLKLKVKSVICIGGGADEATTFPNEAVFIDLSSLEKDDEQVGRMSEEIFGKIEIEVY